MISGPKDAMREACAAAKVLVGRSSKCCHVFLRYCGISPGEIHTQSFFFRFFFHFNAAEQDGWGGGGLRE